jgi:hypothetical protein
VQHSKTNLIIFRSTETAVESSVSPDVWQMPKDCSFGIVQRLKNKASSFFGDFYRKPEEIQKFESLFSSDTIKISLQMQIEVTELQNREVTTYGFN